MILILNKCIETMGINHVIELTSLNIDERHNVWKDCKLDLENDSSSSPLLSPNSSSLPSQRQLLEIWFEVSLLRIQDDIDLDLALEICLLDRDFYWLLRRLSLKTSSRIQTELI